MHCLLLPKDTLSISPVQDNTADTDNKEHPSEAVTLIMNDNGKYWSSIWMSLPSVCLKQMMTKNFIRIGDV
jgi:hypothetical protein